MNKEEKYREILPEIESLIQNESDLTANLANIGSVLHFAFNHHWTGFYLVRNSELVLGPFQGPVACTRIGYGKGVCGKAWEEKKVQLVGNVHLFEGHIACSPHSKSEIVIPLINNNNIWGVLDIDSIEPDYFDETDALYLDKICSLIKNL